MFFVACVGVRFVDYEPLKRKTDLSRERLYELAEDVLLDRGYVIVKREATRGRLTTKVRSLLLSHVSNERFYYAWKIETGGGNLVIRMACNRASRTSLVDCQEEVPIPLAREQQAILTDIVSRSEDQE